MMAMVVIELPYIHHTERHFCSCTRTNQTWNDAFNYGDNICTLSQC